MLPTGRTAATRPAFVVEIPILAGRAHKRRLACVDVEGFDEALIAARHGSVVPPRRVVFVLPGKRMRGWLHEWAHDAERVRRTVVIERKSTGERVMIVGTLSIFGPNVDTELEVESVSPFGSPRAGQCGTEVHTVPIPPLRSGVHAKAAIWAALAEKS